MFWNKTSPEPAPKQVENVSQTCLDRVSAVEKRLSRLEAEILDVATAQDIIRNKVLRKIQSRKVPEEEQESKDIYNGVLIKEQRGDYPR